MQTLNLIDPVPDLVQQVVEALLFAHLPGGVQDEHRVWADIVVHINGDDVRAVEVLEEVRARHYLARAVLQRQRREGKE